MNLLSKEDKWDYLVLGASVLAGLAVRGIAKNGWHLVHKEEPPQNPAAEDVSWRDAILWSMALGMAVGLARMATRKGMATLWEKQQGEKPEQLKE